jgi:hypothetical protein
MDTVMTILLHDHTRLHILRYRNPLLGYPNIPIIDSIDLHPTWGEDNKVYYAYRVPFGEIHELEWYGGDKTILDAGSTLQFTDCDTVGRRSYYLQGKATFTPVPTTPAIAKTIKLSGGIVVTTHGQKVYFDAFENCHRKLIAAYQRGLEIRSKDWDHIIYGNTTASISSDGQFSIARNLDTLSDTHWRKDFHVIDLTIPEIIDGLTRWYDQKIIIQSQDSVITITGLFSKTASLADNLRVLSKWYHIKYSVMKQ